MRTKAYLNLRFQAFQHELRLLLGQLQQFMLGLVVLLGPAVAALLMLMVLALGMLYRPDLSTQSLLLLSWSLLCAQSLGLWLCRDAILAKSYTLFFQSLPVSSHTKHLADLLLLLCCHPFLWLHALIILNANLEQWHQVGPQLYFFVLQCLFAIALLYRGTAVIWLLLLSLPGIALLQLTADGWLFSLLMWSVGLLWVWRSRMTPIRLRIAGNRAWRFWLCLWLDKPSQLLCTALLFLLVLFIAQLTNTERPDLQGEVSLISMLILLLISGSWQLRNARQSAELALFLRQYPRGLARWQYAAPLLCYLFAVMLPAGLFTQWALCWLALPLLPSLWVAERWPRWYLLSWILGCTAAVLLSR